MRITVFSIGTQGDIRPFVALGQGLQRSGHEVRIATSDNFASLVRSAGLAFAPLTADFRQLMDTEGATLRRGLNPLAVLATARRRLKEMAGSWVEEGLAASEGAQLLMGNGMVSALAASLGEALGVPSVQTQLQPVTPSREIPPMILPPPRRPLPGAVNLAVYHGARVFTWRMLSPAIDQVVRRQLRLSAYPWRGPFYRPGAERHPLLYGYSRHLIPRPATWPSTVDVCGYWFLDEARSWSPPADLSRFLAAGPKPVYIGFGSMRSDRAAHITGEVLGALRRTGRRAILATGWGGLQAGVADLADQVIMIEHAPHDWLFPQVELAVHHGGAGTTAAAARAGIPSVVVPFFGDQPFWAWHLQQLGVAPPCLRPADLNAGSLADRIGAAADASMQRRASELGVLIRAENGVDNAIRSLTRWGLLGQARAAA